MVHKMKLRAVWSIAKAEYIKWVTNPRVVTVGILLVFIRSFAVQPMLQRAAEYGEPLNVLEPFLAVCNSSLTALFIPVVFILLMSDFPVLGNSTLLTVLRCGKLNWFLGQMLFALMCILSYLLVLCVGCICMSKGTFSADWSGTIALYNAQFPEESHSFVSELMPPNLYNQMPILRALCGSLGLYALYLLMIALILCLMKMLYFRAMGIFTVAAICAVGASACALQASVMWLFPTANALIWLHYHELLRQPIAPVSRSLFYFIIGNLILLTANLFAAHKLQFRNSEPEGD